MNSSLLCVCALFRTNITENALFFLHKLFLIENQIHKVRICFLVHNIQLVIFDCTQFRFSCTQFRFSSTQFSFCVHNLFISQKNYLLLYTLHLNSGYTIHNFLFTMITFSFKISVFLYTKHNFLNPILVHESLISCEHNAILYLQHNSPFLNIGCRSNSLQAHVSIPRNTRSHWSWNISTDVSIFLTLSIIKCIASICYQVSKTASIFTPDIPRFTLL